MPDSRTVRLEYSSAASQGSPLKWVANLAQWAISHLPKVMAGALRSFATRYLRSPQPSEVTDVGSFQRYPTQRSGASGQ